MRKTSPSPISTRRTGGIDPDTTMIADGAVMNGLHLGPQAWRIMLTRGGEKLGYADVPRAKMIQMATQVLAFECSEIGCISLTDEQRDALVQCAQAAGRAG